MQELQELLDDASVVISASAAAQAKLECCFVGVGAVAMADACRAHLSQAAVAFLLGERDFTDAEQRCAQQSKQAHCPFIGKQVA